MPDIHTGDPKLDALGTKILLAVQDADKEGVDAKVVSALLAYNAGALAFAHSRAHDYTPRGWLALNRRIYTILRLGLDGYPITEKALTDL